MTIALDKSYKSTFYLQLHNEMSAYKCVVIFSNIILVETTWMCLTVDSIVLKATAEQEEIQIL